MNDIDTIMNDITACIGQLQTLPVPDEVTEYVLLDERIIYLLNEINIDSLYIQRMILRWNIEDVGVPVEKRKPIRLFIMNYGGELVNMWALVDAIDTSVTPVWTVNVGVAASAAALVFVAGKKRFVMPHSVVMIHEGSAQFGGDSTKVLDASASYKNDIQKMKDYIMSRTAITKAQLSKKKNNDWEISAEECLSLNVCDHIVTSIEDLFCDKEELK